jgi:hypothetical protein
VIASAQVRLPGIFLFQAFSSVVTSQGILLIFKSIKCRPRILPPVFYVFIHRVLPLISLHFYVNNHLHGARGSETWGCRAHPSVNDA